MTERERIKCGQCFGFYEHDVDCDGHPESAATLRQQVEQLTKERDEARQQMFKTLSSEQIESCLALGQAEMAASREYWTGRYRPEKGGPAMERLREARAKHATMFPDPLAELRVKLEAAESRASAAAEAALQKSEADVVALREALVAMVDRYLEAKCLVKDEKCFDPACCQEGRIRHLLSSSFPGASVLKGLEAAEGMAKAIDKCLCEVLSDFVYGELSDALAKWAEVKP